jgi:hypothetical protein
MTISTRLAANVVREVCIGIGHGSLSFADDCVLAQHVAEAFCQRTVEHYMFAPLRPIMQRRLGLTYADVHALQTGLLDAIAPYLAKTAERLLQDVSGAEVKRPDPRASFKASTSDLLHVNLLG